MRIFELLPLSFTSWDDFEIVPAKSSLLLKKRKIIIEKQLENWHFYAFNVICDDPRNSFKDSITLEFIHDTFYPITFKKLIQMFQFKNENVIVKKQCYIEKNQRELIGTSFYCLFCFFPHGKSLKY